MHPQKFSIRPAGCTGQRVSKPAQIGKILLGGGQPVRVQSMTNTDTANVDETVGQIMALAEAGSELVRMSIMNEASAAAIPYIKDKLLENGVDVPLIGDFHFNGHLLLKRYPDCAKTLDKYRINPGNVGKGEKKDIQFAEMIETACRYNKAVRIGVNWGSLDPDLLSGAVEANNKSESPLSSEALMCRLTVQSALESAVFAENVGLPHHQIVLSCKLSHVQSLIKTYLDLSTKCDYALHLGLTEAGMGMRGIVASAAALAVLLQQGIGDTIRVSLTPAPDTPRTEEVKVAWTLLQSMGFRNYRPTVISCPGCGRTRSVFFRQLAAEVEAYIERRWPEWQKRYPQSAAMSVAVMGCVVNGPGESRQANIGISLPGAAESAGAPVYADGVRIATLKQPGMSEAFMALLDEYVATRYGSTNHAV